MKNIYKKLIFTIFTIITTSLSNNSFTMFNLLDTNQKEERKVEKYYKNAYRQFNKQDEFEKFQSRMFIESQLKDDQNKKDDQNNLYNVINQLENSICIICLEKSLKNINNNKTSLKDLCDNNKKKIIEPKCKNKDHKNCSGKWLMRIINFQI